VLRRQRQMCIRDSVCGDESKMAKDVHQAIKNVLIKEQNLSETDAEEYLKQMKRDKRYQRDVY
ncbi:hypothetical protein P3G70_14885, partial [Staphylococcus aureus]|uniref:hypothetical protein n=1 Tax=Staphylococcus aureus TaxID=1280 RepID=UPI0023E2627E